MSYSTEGRKAYKDFESALKRTIARKGMKQVDKRLNRTTMSLPGHFGVLKNPKMLELLAKKELPEKYNADLARIRPGLNKIIGQAKKDLNSRRLMTFNDVDYYNVYPCFTSFHFVYTHRKEFDLYVYQRSSDVMKLEEDCAFYSKLAKTFSEKVGKKVTKIVIVFGHIHYQV